VTELGDKELSSEQIAVLKDRLNQPDPLKLLANMAVIFADPARIDREIKKFQDAKTAAERAQANLANARAKHDEQIEASTAELAKATAELESLRSTVAKREQALMQREEALRASEANFREREHTFKLRSREIVELPGGMTRETPPGAPEAPDPHYGSA
jgi:chromosome segregation ATPase